MAGHSAPYSDKRHRRDYRFRSTADDFALRSGFTTTPTARPAAHSGGGGVECDPSRLGWTGHTFEVRLAPVAASVEAEIDDDGRPFDPLGHLPFDPTPHSTGAATAAWVRT
ncbi:hypothetical protein FTUN_6584 [Frigoriglobus tundricola]|uniref:Uncharacterized protein n=1 Tax=Frigoriglobus tundricola TaxID=2774151 RepID=A0A6M5YYQ4_9BACT|nr:hypothetical protein FTUN_6584 [Frigoriglobus tundricola]